MALYNHNDLVAPRLSLHNVYSSLIWLGFVLWSGYVPCNSSGHREHGKKAAVPIYKVLARPGRESTSRPTSPDADALCFFLICGSQNSVKHWRVACFRALLHNSETAKGQINQKIISRSRLFAKFSAIEKPHAARGPYVVQICF